jgi:RNA polymerase sigma factor (sigma-70 family)
VSASTVPYPKPVDRDELNSLVRRAQAGDAAALNRAVLVNMRIVVAMASKLARSMGRDDLLNDLIQAGAAGDNRGLVRAVMNFDPDRGLTFSTYARAWIHSAMMLVIAGEESLQGGRSSFSWRHAIRHTADRLTKSLGRAPSPEEIRADFVNRGKAPPSLQRCKFSAGPGVVVEQLTDDMPSEAAPDELVMALDCGRLQSALDQLSTRERYIIQRRWGLGDYEKLEYAAIGRELDVSRQRIRQLETRALRKLAEILQDAA